jgi:hypothetical protein
MIVSHCQAATHNGTRSGLTEVTTMVRWKRTALALGLPGLILGACSSGAGPAAIQPRADAPQERVPALSPTAVEDVQAATQPAEAPPAMTPTARPGLQATDPTTVNLASGKPTLLEFFAFW